MPGFRRGAARGRCGDTPQVRDACLVEQRLLGASSPRSLMWPGSLCRRRSGQATMSAAWMASSRRCNDRWPPSERVARADSEAQDHHFRMIGARPTGASVGPSQGLQPDLSGNRYQNGQGSGTAAAMAPRPALVFEALGLEPSEDFTWVVLGSCLGREHSFRHRISAQCSSQEGNRHLRITRRQ
jgi:hypothetical protein